MSRNGSASSTRSPLKFFLLVFALSIPLWIIEPMVKVKGLPLDAPVTDFIVTFIPLIAASTLVYQEEGTTGIKSLLKRIFDFSKIKQKIWYLPIIFLMPIIYLSIYGVMQLFRLPLPVGMEIPFLQNALISVVSACIIFHSMANIGRILFPKDQIHNPLVDYPDIHYSIIAIAAVIVIFLWGSKTLARYRYA